MQYNNNNIVAYLPTIYAAASLLFGILCVKRSVYKNKI